MGVEVGSYSLAAFPTTLVLFYANHTLWRHPPVLPLGCHSHLGSSTNKLSSYFMITLEPP